MSDKPNDTTPASSPDDLPPTTDEAGSGEEESLLDRRGSGRPTIVYIALAAGAAVLVLLLIIVWLSSRDDNGRDSILCLDIGSAEAERLILDGEITEVDVLIDDQQPLDGLAAIQLYLIDGQCRALPEGADNRAGLYQALGQVTLFNEAGEQDIQVNYVRGVVPGALLNTSTPIVTETPVVTVTPASPAAVAPAATDTPTPAPTEPPASPSPEPAPATPIPRASPAG